MSFGVFNLPWWGDVAVALLLTHITIVAVTIYLHRHQAHRALDLHPAVSHFFRMWLWLTTGMVTREWAAVHRKHHAKCDTPEDPHSPQNFGINRVLWGGVFLYVREARNAETLERYGQGTPDDWLERNVYSKFQITGLALMAAADLVLFGLVPGVLIFVTQVVWIPFWAAGVINGLGHHWGYRRWPTPDASTNIVPLGVLIGGEELHNNHHAYPSSAKLSMRWYEIDVGWLYIRLLESVGLARVKRVAPIPHLTAPRPVVDRQTLEAIVACRYAVLAQYGRFLRRAYREEIEKLRRFAPNDAQVLRMATRWLIRDETLLREQERTRLAELLSKSEALRTMHSMRRDLAVVWARSTATRDQLVAQLQNWCRRAETSEIEPLVAFSRELRRYS